MAARTVASNGDAIGIEVEQPSLCSKPFECCLRVVECSGEVVLGGKPIIDRDDRPAARIGECPAHCIVRVEVAKDEAAAVAEQDC